LSRQKSVQVTVNERGTKENKMISYWRTYVNIESRYIHILFNSPKVFIL